MNGMSSYLVILVVFIGVFVFFMRLSAQRAKEMLAKFDDQARRADQAAQRAEEQNRHLDRIATALEARQK